MIRLHVVNHQVIHRPSTGDLLHIFQVFVNKRAFNGINQSDLFVNDQVGIVRNSLRKGPEVFEQMGAAVVVS